MSAQRRYSGDPGNVKSMDAYVRWIMRRRSAEDDSANSGGAMPTSSPASVALRPGWNLPASSQTRKPDAASSSGSVGAAGVDTVTRQSRGLLGVVGVTICAVLGLLLIAHADSLSRKGSAYGVAAPFFWSGLLLVFCPAAFRAISRTTSRGERMTQVVILGIGLYLVKVLAFPSGFAMYDEYIHWRNTQDILLTQRVFNFNPLLPTAAYYPGLGAVTAGLVDLTGLSVFTSGLILVGAARVLIIVAVFVVAEMVTNSSRAASVTSLIYAANPMFLFWSSSFAYEDLALPLAVFTIWWFARTANTTSRLVPVVTIVSIGGIIVTHHIVSLGFAAVLCVWWIVERLTSSVVIRRQSLGAIAVIAGVGAIVWLFFVARPATGYLFTNNIYPALQQTGGLVFGHAPSRSLYASGGYISPEWQTIVGFVAVGLLVVLLPPALYAAWRYAVPKRGLQQGKRGQIKVPIVLAAALAACYPVSLIPRLTSAGIAISGRSSEYIFTGMGCILGLLLEWWSGEREPRLRRSGLLKSEWSKTLIATVVVAVVFVGNVTIGTAFYQLLPESSHPRGYPWTVQPDVIAASMWARSHLGLNQRFGANAEDALALATFGEQDPLAENAVWPIFFAQTLDSKVISSIRSERIRYVFVDWRMTEGVPPTPGYYFSPQEPNARGYAYPFPRSDLQKFDSSCGRIIYSSGDVQIYDLSRIENGSCVPVSKSSGRPVSQ